MAQVRTAEVTWTGAGMQFDARLGSGYALTLNSQAGADSGASPMELLLAGVAGCTAVDVVHTLQKMRQPLAGLTVSIRGIRADSHPKVYTAAEIVYMVRGQGVDPRAVERAISLSKKTYCSASVMFERAGVAVTTRYEIEAA